MLNAILLALAPVFFVMVLGYGAGRLRIVDNHNVDSLNALVMDFALPASLFVATASAPRSEMFAQAPLFAILGVVMLMLYLVWFFLARALWGASRSDAVAAGLDHLLSKHGRRRLADSVFSTRTLWHGAGGGSTWRPAPSL